ncbi:SNF2 helicase associated domain-containing protein [uncultured Clostridium sp.]|uniref:DEAD/DEAH box helicase n=1 Tax=uncultured Clostridium sp. TaxID=59620 RepID=UPI0025DDDD78|nr:SNF2 helicase associated domain-containing protein [uncultured Clostridium sp.]
MDVTQLNTLIIKKDINNRLHKGMRCYKEGLVLDVKSMADREYGSLDIYGKIMSESDISVYNTNLSFDIKKGDLIYTECNCRDFENNCDFNSTYICKHIAATFYKFAEAVEEKKKLKNDSLRNTNKNEEVDYSEVILNEIDKVIKNKRERVNLKINISKKSVSRNSFYYELDLKIGVKRYYVVKNIIDLINAKKNNKILSYGKEFKYDPTIHYFSDDDERVLNFIEEYVSLNEAFEKEYSVQRITNNVFGSNKTLFIPQSALRRFLNNIKNESISLTEDELSEEVEILREDLPIKFSIKEENNEIKLSSTAELPKPMTYKGDVYLYNSKLYLPNFKQIKYYKTINDILNKESSISFKNKNKQKVINKVIPLLELISDNICIDENLNKNIVKEDLKLEVYFDRERNKTWAEVKAIYGEISFNILKGPKDDEYVIRNINEEEKIEQLLNNLSFYRNNDKFIFNGNDEKLFELLSEDLTVLKEEATIFYSDRFKERRIYGATSINAKISEGSGNYLEFTFNIENVNEDEYKKIIEAFKENRKFFKLKDESFIDFREEEVKNLFNLIDSLSDDTDIKSNEIKVHKSKSIFLNECLKDNNLLFIEGRDIVKHISNKIENLEKIDYKVPEELKATLRDYQLTGFKWFKTLSHYEFGGILADEMGLGKTIQTIAFLLSEKNKKSIIITPTSLIYNWRSEFEKFAPTMNIKVVHGNKENREFTKDEIKDIDVLITTYGTLRNDHDLYDDITFDFCIIDEGQNIKNPLSQSSEVVKELKAKVKFALTGTPIENNLIELWSLFDYILPGYLYSKRKFQDKFMKGENGSEELKKLIRPFILRRLKSDVMSELPDKIEKRFLIEMTEEQKKVYKAYVDDVNVKMKEKDFTTDKITIFSYLTKLRQLTLDPSILIEGYTGGSGKIDVTVELIQDFIKEKHKILLFSQFTSVLDSIKKVLEAEGIEYFYLDGSTKASERVQLVNEFNESNKVKIFLISLKAGGTGLNLTSADVVIHFDPWWNPAIEDQATDRAHRFGQKNVVEVIKLIAKGSIEEKIIKLQESKKEIINEIMSGNYTNGGFLSSLSADEIRDLFN